MTDAELRNFFSLPGRVLPALRNVKGFPAKDPLIGKTDRFAVDRFFDVRIVPAAARNGGRCVADTGVMVAGTDAATASAFGSGVERQHYMNLGLAPGFSF